MNEGESSSSRKRHSQDARESGPGKVRVLDASSSCAEMVGRLMEMFPDLSRPFLEERCKGAVSVEEVVQGLLEGGGEEEGRVEDRKTRLLAKWVADHMLQLEALFPQTSPAFLKERLEGLVKNNKVTMGLKARYHGLLEALGEEDKMPSRRDWQQDQVWLQEVRRWSSMSAKELLRHLPDPETYFSDPSRALPSSYRATARQELLATFPLQAASVVELELARSGTYLGAVRALQGREASRREGSLRAGALMSHNKPEARSIEVVKEKRFLELEDEVMKIRTQVTKERDEKVEAARKKDLLTECLCCYSEDCLPQELVRCPDGHAYCSDCVSRAARVVVGEGKSAVLCLGQCHLELEEPQLRQSVEPEVLSRLLARKQAKEVEEAGLEGLEQCPACTFSLVMEDPSDRVLICRNPVCGAETCRSCREPSHLPLPCGATKDQAEKVRKEVEEQLTKALVRQCYKCKKEFIRETGCNVMTCPCGAKQCYVCHKPLTQHYCSCPGMSDAQVHAQDLARAVQTARAKLVQEGVQLEVDPLAGLAPMGRSMEEVRSELYKQWSALSTMAGGMVDQEASRNVLRKLDIVLKMIQGEFVCTAEPLIKGNLAKLVKEVKS